MCESERSAKLASVGFREESQLGANQDIFHRKVPFLDVEHFGFASCPWMPARTIILGPAIVIARFHLAMVLERHDSMRFRR